jgi:hypothetical protein
MVAPPQEHQHQQQQQQLHHVQEKKREKGATRRRGSERAMALVLGFVGKGEWLFLAPVSKLWRDIYAKLETQRRTSMIAAFENVARLEEANAAGLQAYCEWPTCTCKDCAHAIWGINQPQMICTLSAKYSSLATCPSAAQSSLALGSASERL